MLVELDIESFAVARHVRLRLGEGLTAITGETGAGKSILLDALAVLLGGRTDTDVVRAGERMARVEGVFVLDEAVRSEVEELLAAHGVEPDADGGLLVVREVPATGRGLARICGRAAPQALLTALGRRLVDLHGQADHLALLRPAEHLSLLDRYVGAAPLRAELAASVAELRAVRADLRGGELDERERARRIDRLTYEIDEIAAADPRPGEDEALAAERQVLASAAELARLAEEARASLDDGAVEALGSAVAATEAIARLDGRFAEQARAIAALQDAAADSARAARAYRDEIQADPERLEAVEARLAVLKELTRKYGPTITDVLAYAERAREELRTIEGAEERIAELRARERALVTACAEIAVRLAGERRSAAASLARDVQAELATLGLGSARFGVRFERRAADDGLPVELPAVEVVVADGDPACEGAVALAAFERAGVEDVGFVVAFNPNEPLRPLARVASGGELSRLVLALKTVLGARDDVPTLVFDEVESGLGSRSGGVVAEKLAAIARDRQVLCITHLAQVAARASRHVVVRKSIEDGRATVEVREVEGEERLAELAAMLGGDTPENRRSARALLAGPPQVAASGAGAA